MVAILGHGVYSFPEAAKLTGLNVYRIRDWFRVRDDRLPPAFRSDYEGIEGERAISFLDLINVNVAGQLRERGISFQTVRKVYAKLVKEFNTPHPFARQELYTDGKKVFLRGMDKEGKVELQEVLTNQGVFAEIILPFLERIEYDIATSLALRWNVRDNVTLDPAVCFGQPIIKDAGIPTRLVFAAYRANQENVAKVADWYKVTADQVVAAVEFEISIAA